MLEQVWIYQQGAHTTNFNVCYGICSSPKKVYFYEILIFFKKNYYDKINQILTYKGEPWLNVKDLKNASKRAIFVQYWM